MHNNDLKVLAAEICTEYLSKGEVSCMDEHDRLVVMANMIQFLSMKMLKSHEKWKNIHDKANAMEGIIKANESLTDFVQEELFSPYTELLSRDVTNYKQSN